MSVVCVWLGRIVMVMCSFGCFVSVRASAEVYAELFVGSVRCIEETARYFSIPRDFFQAPNEKSLW